MTDARQSLANSRKNEAMRALVASAGWQWAAAMALGYAFLLWSRRASSPLLGSAAALAAWAGVAWLARVPWPLAGGHELAFGRAGAAWNSAPGAFVLALAGAAAALTIFALARRPSRARPAPITQSMSSRIGYPGFVLATGLGALILLDLSLAGHASNRYLALYHQGHLWLAMLALSILLFARRSLSRGFAWLLSVGGETLGRASRRHGRFSVAVAARPGDGRCRARLRPGLRPPAPAHVGDRPRLADRRRRLVLLPARRHRSPSGLRASGKATTSFLRYVWPLLFVVAC